ncbi:MAG: RagB/SusD family nutrient uptake outer membrane protein [Rikenellaceae bacterium]
MKNIFKFLLLSIVACGVTSCEDFLYPDNPDKLLDETFYRTDAQIESALTSIYATLRNGYFGGTTYTYSMNGVSDELLYYNVSTEDNISNYSPLSSNSTVSGFWSANYTVLKDISYLLDGLERNKDVLTESVYLHAKGEALFLRGYFHFMLAAWFCHPDTGIPMYTEKITTYDETKMPLSSLDEIYAQIIEDMEAAEVLLVDQTWASLGYSECVTLDAVRGVLARVALHAAGYPNYGKYKGSYQPEFFYKKALSKALMVTEMSHELQPFYGDVFIDQVQDAYNSENIWEVGFQYAGIASDDTNTGGNHGYTCGISRTYKDPITSEDIYDSLLCSTTYYPNPLLYTTYGHGDERRMWNFPNFTYEYNRLNVVPRTLTTSNCSAEILGSTNYDMGTIPSAFIWGNGAGKWRRVYESRISRGQSSTSTNFPLLRYSDVLLMVAEAYIELGDPASAAPYINQVRSRSIPYTAPTKIIGRIIVNASVNQYGYAHDPVVTVTDPGSGTGFEYFVGHNIIADSYRGTFSIGISEPGSGYDEVPTLSVEAPVPTWQANTSYSARDYVSVQTDPTSTTLRIYEASQDGISTSVAPSHTTSLYDDDGTNTATSPTLSEASAEQGVVWIHRNASGTTVSPQVTVEAFDSDVADVSYHVSISDQEAMRQFLRDERLRELCYEAHRRLDLKRWGITQETIQGMSSLLTGDVAGVPASTGTNENTISSAAYYCNADYKNYLPIPLEQLTLNRNLIQTPGY